MISAQRECVQGIGKGVLLWLGSVHNQLLYGTKQDAENEGATVACRTNEE